MKNRLEAISSTTLTVCAVLVTSAYLWGQFGSGESGNSSEPAFVQNWADLGKAGILLGPDSAIVEFMAFIDFECPFCGHFFEAAEELMADFPGHVSVRYAHFPLKSHPMAMEAAVVSECAAREVGFQPIARALFEGQVSLGKRDWYGLAQAAGVSDSLSFSQCLEEEQGDAALRIEEDLAVGGNFSIAATPTVFINGWRYPAPPDAETLRQIATELVAGDWPFPGRRPR
jgi:protein-disulfide isomerase